MVVADQPTMALVSVSVEEAGGPSGRERARWRVRLKVRRRRIMLSMLESDQSHARDGNMLASQ